MILVELYSVAIRRVRQETLLGATLKKEEEAEEEEIEEGIIFIIKPTRITNFSNLHVSDSICAHHHESSTVHTAISICDTGYANCLLAGSGWNSSILILLASSQHNLYDIYLLLCVQC